MNGTFIPRVFAVLRVDHILFISLSVDGHLGCLHFLAVRNTAVVNIHVSGFV